MRILPLLFVLLYLTTSVVDSHCFHCGFGYRFNLDADPDPESQTNADLDPGQTFTPQKVEFLNEKYMYFM